MVLKNEGIRTRHDTLARWEACRPDRIDIPVITHHPLNFHKRPLSDRRQQYVNSTYPECRQLVIFFSAVILYILCMKNVVLIALRELVLFSSMYGLYCLLQRCWLNVNTFLVH